MDQYKGWSLNAYMEKVSDKRSLEWPMIGSPGKLILLTLLYVVFCKKLGPAMMEGRKPFDVKRILIVYNLYQIIINAVIFSWSLACMYAAKFNFLCQPVKMYDGSIEDVIFLTGYMYVVSRFVDLLDTIFFVVTKKYSHISGLHLFHHSFMALANWFAFSVAPDGHGTFYGVVNSFVHVVMYTYYLIAVLGPEFKKYLWWKRYLTILQIIQFFIVCVHEAIPLFFVDCSYPKIWNILCLMMGIVFTLLFSNFYYHAYVLGRKKVQLQQRRGTMDATGLNGFKSNTKKDLEQTWNESTANLLSRNRKLMKCQQ